MATAFSSASATAKLLEAWRAQGPDGKKKLVHLLFGFRSPEKIVKEAVQRFRSVQHPALFTPEIVHVDKGRLLLVTDYFRETLRDRFRQCQQRKQPGIVRGELMDYIRAAAEVLDYLYQQHGVQHLNLNPRKLVLDNGWLQIAEFGFAQMLWLPEGQDVARRNARYAAPELFGPDRPRGCDQYSLALVYAEMLTGVHPFQGRSPAIYVGRGTIPDLGAGLADLDRVVIARALDADPQKAAGSRAARKCCSLWRDPPARTQPAACGKARLFCTFARQHARQQENIDLHRRFASRAQPGHRRHHRQRWAAHASTLVLGIGCDARGRR